MCSGESGAGVETEEPVEQLDERLEKVTVRSRSVSPVPLVPASTPDTPVLLVAAAVSAESRRRKTPPASDSRETAGQQP